MSSQYRKGGGGGGGDLRPRRAGEEPCKAARGAAAPARRRPRPAGATGVAAWRGRREHRPCDDASKYLRERRTAERGPRAPVRLAHAPH